MRRRWPSRWGGGRFRPTCGRPSRRSRRPARATRAAAARRNRKRRPREPAMSKKQIIIIKKGKGHGGHHGGAWKVAYADFVTAMMSLFIVLWLLNSSEHVRKAVAGYFNDPLGRSTLN